jgi:cytochrome c biogenesis protein CcmG/thiol:disulfide interchange protein DsbE
MGSKIAEKQANPAKENWQGSIPPQQVFINMCKISDAAFVTCYTTTFHFIFYLISLIMKKLTLFFSLVMLAGALSAQNKTLPTANVKTPEGQTINVKDLAPEGKITVFSFWATWCKPCIAELDAIKDLYPEWKEKYNVEFVAVSVDDARTSARIKTVAANKGWEYTIVNDASKEFQTAMNVSNPPLTVLVNQKGEIIFEHLGYTSGDELELEEKIKAAAGKE